MKKTFKKRNYSKYSSKVEYNNTTQHTHHITSHYTYLCVVSLLPLRSISKSRVIGAIHRWEMHSHHLTLIVTHTQSAGMRLTV